MELETAMQIRWLATPLGLVICWYTVREVRTVQTLYLKVFVLMGVLYPLGKIIQYWFWIPQVLRFYMSDVGFIPFIGFILFQHYRYRRMLRYRNKVSSSLDYVQKLAKATRLAFVIAFIVEILQIYANWYFVPGPDIMSFKGDPIDAAVFITVYLVCEYLILGRLESTTEDEEPRRRRKKRGPSN